MCKHPITPPTFTHKRMTVFQHHLALSGFADVGNHVFRFNRIAFNQIRHRRADRRLMIDKQPHPTAFKKGDTPAIFMLVGQTAARRKPRETKHDIRRGVAIHSK